jgi:hypothetical protein
LLLKKIAIEKFFDENIITIRGFIKQYTLFMKTEILIDKIMSLYNYFDNLSEESRTNKSKNDLIK